MLDMSLTLLSVFSNIMVISSIRDKEEFLGKFYFNKLTPYSNVSLRGEVSSSYSQRLEHFREYLEIVTKKTF